MACLTASDCAGSILARPYCYFLGCFGSNQAEVEVASKNKNLVEQKSDGCGRRAGLHTASFQVRVPIGYLAGFHRKYPSTMSSVVCLLSSC